MEQFVIKLNEFSPLITVLAGTFVALFLSKDFRLSPDRYFYNHIFPSILNDILNILKETEGTRYGIEEPFKIYKNVIDRYINEKIKMTANDSFEKRIYLLSFLFCIFVLSYIGLEYYFIKANYFYALLPVTLFFLIHNLLSFYFYIIKDVLRKRQFLTMISSTNTKDAPSKTEENPKKRQYIVKTSYILILFISWFLMFFVSLPVINVFVKSKMCFCIFLSQNFIYIIVLASCVVGFLLLIIKYLNLLIFCKKLTKTEKIFSNFLDICLRKYYLGIIEIEIP